MSLVFMSSLLQVPFILEVIVRINALPLLLPRSVFLKDEHLKNVGIDLNSNFIVAVKHRWMNITCREFDNLWNAQVP